MTTLKLIMILDLREKKTRHFYPLKTFIVHQEYLYNSIHMLRKSNIRIYYIQ